MLPCGAEMTSPSPGVHESEDPTSAHIVAEAARVSQAAQLAELNALDGKAANLIGFVVIVIGVLCVSASLLYSLNR